MGVLNDCELERARRLADTHPDSALRTVADLSRDVSRADDPEAIARLGIVRGRAHLQRGEHFEALAAARSAHGIWLAAGRSLSALSASVVTADALNQLGEHHNVVELLDRLLHDLAALHVDPSDQREFAGTYAGAHVVLGSAWHALGDHHRSLRHHDIAGNGFRSLQDTSGAARACQGRGLAQLALGMAHRASEEFLQAYRLHHGEGRERQALQSLMRLAEAQVALGRANGALRFLDRVPEDLLGPGSSPDRGRFLWVRASALLLAGRAAEAEPLARGAADIFADRTLTRWSGRAELLGAQISMALGRYEVAKAGLAAAGRLFAACGAGEDEARVWLHQAELALITGQPRHVLRLTRRVLAACDGQELTPLAGQAHLLLAEVTGPAARTAHLDAVVGTALGTDDRGLQFSLQMLLARLRRDAGEHDAAIAAVRGAAVVAERIERDDPSAATRTSSGSRAARARSLLVDLLVEKGTYSAAIDAWRCANEAGGTTGAPAGPDASGRFDRELIGEDPTGRRVEGRRVEGSRWSLPTPEALTRALAGADDQVVAERPAIAVPEGPVLQYFVLESDVIAFVIREGQVHVRRLRDATLPTRHLVRSWQDRCAVAAQRDPSSVSTDLDWAGQDLAALHDLLIAPLEDLLEGDEPDWLVVGHEHLHAVPFEAFSILDRRRVAGVGAARFEFNSIPHDGRDQALAAGHPLILAVPDPQAPLIREEGEEVSGLLVGAQLHVGPEATSELLSREAPGRSLVHLACHAVFQADDPLSSALLLADGPMTARELLGVDLSGCLVVLSACASGSTATHGGVPVGLAWACLAAGARGVLATMWPVHDAVAREFMPLFYERLAAGHDAVPALSLARAELARTHPDPYFWAAFRIFGSEGSNLPATAPVW